MNLLTQIGKYGFKVLQYLLGVTTQFSSVPALEKVLVKAGDILQLVLFLVSNAEVIGGIVKAQEGTKLDKLALVLPEVEKAIRNSELLVGKQVIDEATFRSAVECFVEGGVRLLKSVKQVA